MWTNFKSLFSSKAITDDNKLSIAFEQQVNQAIHLIEISDNLNTDEELFNYFTANGIGQTEAIEILLFLPVAFVRQWLPTVKWLDYYAEIDKNKKAEKKYADTNSYQIIWKVTADYFNDKPSRDTIVKIGGRSAEFNAINQLLNDNPNSKIEDLSLSQSVIIR